LDISVREKFVDNIIDALDNRIDTTTSKKKFRIPNIWEGKE